MSDTLPEQVSEEEASGAVPAPAPLPATVAPVAPVAIVPIIEAPPIKLSGSRKAAILCIELGPDIAAEIMKHMKPKMIDQLAVEMAQAGMITPEEREAALAEFVQIHTARNYAASGGIDYAKLVLEKALGEDRALQIINNLSAFVEVQPFDFMRRVQPNQLISILKKENPQTIALVLAFIDQTMGGEVLAALPPEVKTEVAERVAEMETTDPRIIQRVQDVMEKNLAAVLNSRQKQAGGVDRLVEVLGNIDRSSERQILDDLDQRNPELAEEIRKRMFVFENIITLDDRDLQAVLREFGNDVQTLGLALKGVEGEISDKFFANLPEATAEDLRDEIEILDTRKIKKAEVEEAQTRIVDLIRKLDASGDITIARSNEEFV
jgi:flagellar motor switch protein FliG